MTTLSLPADHTSLGLASLVQGIPTTMSLVVDENGSTVNEAGNSLGIGNEVDLKLLIELRRNSQVVLTSGATFRADKYQFPKTADLAVLSHTSPKIATPTGRRLHWLRSDYASAIAELHGLGYERIHIEYGLKGLAELRLAAIPFVLFVSSTSGVGLQKFLREQQLRFTQIDIPGLFLAVVAWQ